MKENDDAYFDIRVEKCGDELFISHDVGEGDVPGHAVAFVAECARKFKLKSTWSATYSGGAVVMDLDLQAPAYVDRDEVLAIAQKEIEKVMAQKVTFPFAVTMGRGMAVPTEWLQENFGDEWGRYTRAVIVDDGCAGEEQVFLFKTDADAVLFKLAFGGVAQQ